MSTNVNHNLITIGLDIGYGVTKAVCSTGATAIFPSVWGLARDIQFGGENLAETYPGDQLTDDTGKWFIGDLASSQLTPGELLKLRGRGANEMEIGNLDRLRLAKAAIGKLLPGQHNGDVIHVRIATGLPVDHMDGAADLKASLSGVHVIHSDQGNFVVNVAEVMVMPQPYGTLYRNSLTPTGEIDTSHVAKRTGVVDVGTYTVDLTLDDDGEFIGSESGSIESGVFLAHDRIAALINKTYKQIPKFSTVDGVLRTGSLRAKGESVNYANEVTQALKPMILATVSKMGDLWQAGLNLDVIYLSGGGASFVESAVKEAGFGQAELVENPQVANAQGYLNYAIWRAKGN